MRELTIAEAEEIAGERLDRRRKYATADDGKPDDDGFVLFSLGSWTSPCSGCADEDVYSNADRGAGCPECGYTGKRRNSMWLPHLMPGFRLPVAQASAENMSAGHAKTEEGGA